MTMIRDAKLTELAWLLLCKKIPSVIKAQGGIVADNAEYSTTVTSSSTWPSYMSLLGETKPVSKVSILPLISASPTGHSVQLSFMEQSGKMNSFVL